MAEDEVSGNHERKMDNPLSGLRMTRNDDKTNTTGSNISELFPELLGSVIIEAMDASSAFHIKMPVRAKQKNSSNEGKWINSMILPTGTPVN